jgi:hypothetical protein
MTGLRVLSVLQSSQHYFVKAAMSHSRLRHSGSPNLSRIRVCSARTASWASSPVASTVMNAPCPASSLRRLSTLLPSPSFSLGPESLRRPNEDPRRRDVQACSIPERHHDPRDDWRVGVFSKVPAQKHDLFSEPGALVRALKLHRRARMRTLSLRVRRGEARACCGGRVGDCGQVATIRLPKKAGYS